jgi:hypothetical protein
MQPESSDGFASVGTVLPSEEVALLPGGLFLFPAYSALLAPTMDNAERYIAKWQGAGLLDEQSASAIRAYETAQARPSGLRGDGTGVRTATANPTRALRFERLSSAAVRIAHCTPARLPVN